MLPRGFRFFIFADGGCGTISEIVGGNLKQKAEAAAAAAAVAAAAAEAADSKENQTSKTQTQPKSERGLPQTAVNIKQIMSGGLARSGTE